MKTIFKLYGLERESQSKYLSKKFLEKKKVPKKKIRRPERKRMAAINVAQDREFVKKMTIFDRHCAENGKLLTKILCNMLIESFGGFLYTGNTPKKVFTLFAKKKAALFRCGFEKSFLKVKNLSDFGKERVKWKREKDFKVHLVS